MSSVPLLHNSSDTNLSVTRNAGGGNRRRFAWFFVRPGANLATATFRTTFKASDRLTLNLGVRYTLNFPSTVVVDRAAVFNLQTQKLTFLGKEWAAPDHARELEN